MRASSCPPMVRRVRPISPRARDRYARGPAERRPIRRSCRGGRCWSPPASVGRLPGDEAPVRSAPGGRWLAPPEPVAVRGARARPTWVRPVISRRRCLARSRGGRPRTRQSCRGGQCSSRPACEPAVARPEDGGRERRGAQGPRRSDRRPPTLRRVTHPPVRTRAAAPARPVPRRGPGARSLRHRRPGEGGARVPPCIDHNAREQVLFPRTTRRRGRAGHGHLQTL